MIQRRQSLFLFQLVFLAVALMFIPAQHTGTVPNQSDINLVPYSASGVESTKGHIAAIAMNLAGLVLAFVTIFLYRKRELQIKLCYVLTILWTVVALMILFCPFTEKTGESLAFSPNYFAVAIAAFGIAAALLAIKFIKRDIELLKSADRIR